MPLPDFVSTLEATTVFTSVLQFLSGALVCKKFIQKKSTGDSSGFPFLCGFLSCSFWLRYSILSQEHSITLVNIIGVSFFLIYVLIYYVVTVNKTSFLKQIVLIFAFLLGVIYFTDQIDEPAKKMRIMGIICCVVTVGFFAAPLTMLFHVIRMKNSESLPFPMIVMSFLGCLQWLIYGIIISDTFVQIPNFLGCVLSLFQLLLFVCYPPKSFNGKGYKLVDQADVF